ncbi:bleomycin resistance protein [Qipengyuania soli]|uniref:Bleomycin resistance protein n=1 Tax=Qipengyuania soli TaxID=2782568 RepID=A0A7S8IWQ2_9SPHN|nr:bleomycin resistance protein [Qipengyuania soli]QPD00277.1 hypothetical protein IRL76_07095 [Qipengyuania soli]
MADRATPNLPARDFDATEKFYAALGFERTWRDNGWMILCRGDLQLEFFPWPDFDPATSSFGSCLRVDDFAGLMEAVVAAGIPNTRQGFPRYHPPQREASGLEIAYLIDPDCSLLRLIQNP